MTSFWRLREAGGPLGEDGQFKQLKKALLGRLNGEIKRRTEVVGIFPNEAAITPLVGSILLEENDKWAVQRAGSISLWKAWLQSATILWSGCPIWTLD